MIPGKEKQRRADELTRLEDEVQGCKRQRSLGKKILLAESASACVKMVPVRVMLEAYVAR